MATNIKVNVEEIGHILDDLRACNELLTSASKKGLEGTKKANKHCSIGYDTPIIMDHIDKELSLTIGGGILTLQTVLFKYVTTDAANKGKVDGIKGVNGLKASNENNTSSGNNLSNSNRSDTSSSTNDFDYKFSLINDKNPPSQIQIKKCNSNGEWGDDAGRCNVSAMTTLLNRRVALDSALDNKEAKYFTAVNVLEVNGCKDIIDHGNKKGHYQAIQFNGTTGSMHSKTYSNGIDTYTGKVMYSDKVKSIVNGEPYNGSYESYIAKLLVDHPEGVVIRNTKANHVAVITGFKKEGDKISLFIDDSYNDDDTYKSFQGAFEESYMYRKGGKEKYWNSLNYIAYLK